MANFPNPFSLPDDEYYYRRYINDLPNITAEIALDLPSAGIGDNLGNWDDAVNLIRGGHGCPCDASGYSVLNTISDDFERANGPGLQLANWREIQYDLGLAPNPGNPNNTWPSISTCRILDGRFENHRPENAIDRIHDGSTCVGGIRMDANVASNWHVKAIWGTDARIGGTDAPKVILAAPISQTNPSDTAPHLDSLTYFTFTCQRTSSTTYAFILGRVALGLYANVGSFVTKTTAEFGNGSEFSLKVTCNELACPKIQGLINGVVVTESIAGSIITKPPGRPGVGNLFEELPQPATFGTGYLDSFASISSWSAEELA